MAEDSVEVAGERVLSEGARARVRMSGGSKGRNEPIRPEVELQI